MCEVVTVEPFCRPCPKTCIRMARPYIGWPGVVSYIFEIPAVIAFTLMLTFTITTDDRWVLGILLGVTIVNVILWAWNLLARAPCYTIVKAPYCENPCGIELIGKPCPGDYARRYLDDAYHTNDETHLRNSILTGLFFLFNYVLTVRSDRRVFDSLLNQTTNEQWMYFIIGKILIMGIIGAYGLGIRALLDATPDLLFRHFTAVPIDRDSEKGAVVNVNLGNKKPQEKQGNISSLRNRNPAQNDEFDILSQ